MGEHEILKRVNQIQMLTTKLCFEQVVHYTFCIN